MVAVPLETASSQYVNNIVIETDSLSWLKHLGRVTDIAVWGDQFFVASEDKGLAVIDASEPPDMPVIARFDTPGYATAAAASGNVAAALDRTGITVIDISDRTRPKRAAKISNRSLVIDIDIASVYVRQSDYSVLTQNFVLAATLDSQLVIYDVMIPSSPRMISALKISSHIVRLLHSYRRVFLLDTGAGITVVNIQDAGRPFIEQTVVLNDCLPSSIDFAYTGAYVGTSCGKVISLQFSKELGWHEASVVEVSDQAIEGVSFDGDFLYINSHLRGLSMWSSYNISPIMSIRHIDPAITGRGQTTIYLDYLFSNTPKGLVMSKVDFSGYLLGDVNLSGVVDTTDAFYLMRYIFSGGAPPLGIWRASNADCSRTISISDAVAILSYFYHGRPFPCKYPGPQKLWTESHSDSAEVLIQPHTGSP